MKTTFKSTLFILCLLTGQVSAGSVYKCVTAEGKTIYQQNPCSTGNHKTEIELHESPVTTEKESGEGEQPEKHSGSLADRLYLERKIKECNRKIDSLKSSRQADVDYWRALMIYQTDTLQVHKIEEIISSVDEDYQRRIDKKVRERELFKEKLKNLDN